MPKSDAYVRTGELTTDSRSLALPCSSPLTQYVLALIHYSNWLVRGVVICAAPLARPERAHLSAARIWRRRRQSPASSVHILEHRPSADFVAARPIARAHRELDSRPSGRVPSSVVSPSTPPATQPSTCMHLLTVTCVSSGGRQGVVVMEIVRGNQTPPTRGDASRARVESRGARRSGRVCVVNGEGSARCLTRRPTDKPLPRRASQSSTIRSTGVKAECREERVTKAPSGTVQ